MVHTLKTYTALPCSVCFDFGHSLHLPRENRLWQESVMYWKCVQKHMHWNLCSYIKHANFQRTVHCCLPKWKSCCALFLQEMIIPFNYQGLCWPSKVTVYVWLLSSLCFAYFCPQCLLAMTASTHVWMEQPVWRWAHWQSANALRASLVSTVQEVTKHSESLRG